MNKQANKKKGTNETKGSAPRENYTPAEQLALTTQVDGRCPLCGTALFHKKKSRNYKSYELAHIYPLNPTPEEIELLKNEAKLNSDVNHPDNLIPLCLKCHGIFDKPRTVEEYRTLMAKKQIFIRRSAQQDIQASYKLEEDIFQVVEGLYSASTLTDNEGVDLTYDPKVLATKFKDSLEIPTQQKIRHNVTDYYPFIRTQFQEIERAKPNTFDLICSQVKTYYLKQKSLNIPQSEIFSNIVDWMEQQTKPQTIEAAEIVTSFFIQNCEVFE